MCEWLQNLHALHSFTELQASHWGRYHHILKDKMHVSKKIHFNGSFRGFEWLSHIILRNF